MASKTKPRGRPRRARPAGALLTTDHWPLTTDLAAEDAADRRWHRQVPAWVISGAIHTALMAIFLVYNYFAPMVQATTPPSLRISRSAHSSTGRTYRCTTAVNTCRGRT